jgi:hypothetical protein
MSATQRIYRLDERQEDRILRDWLADTVKSGKRRLATRYGCTTEDIEVAVARAEARRDGKPVPPIPQRPGKMNLATKPARLTEAHWLEIERLRSIGKSWADIGREFGKSPSYLSEQIRDRRHTRLLNIELAGTVAPRHALAAEEAR